MGLLCDRELCARKAPWKGLACSQITYIKRKSRLEKKISLQSSNNGKTRETDNEQRGTVEDEVTEFHLSSDKESCAGESLVDEEAI